MADEPKVAMWPPRSPGLRLARPTMAIAFQRIIERMRHSICASPGDLASWPGGMVLMYAVVGAKRRCAPARRVRSTLPLRRRFARAGPHRAARESALDAEHV